MFIQVTNVQLNLVNRKRLFIFDLLSNKSFKLPCIYFMKLNRTSNFKVANFVSSNNVNILVMMNSLQQNNLIFPEGN